MENTLFEYLEGVFTTNLDTINKFVDVEDNQVVKEVLKTMSGLGESLENKSSPETSRKSGLRKRQV